MNRASLVLTALLAAGAAAHAQPAPPAPAPTNTDADAAYQEARRFYDLREWDSAIAKFKEAYRLRPDAPSLFNIAQSNRLKGDCAEALSFYKTYKRNFPNEKNIDKVDRFITEMEACVKTKPATEPAKTEPATGEAVPTGPVTIVPKPREASPPPPPPPPPANDPGRTKRIVGLGVGGAGVLALGASVFFGLRAHSAANDAEGGTQGQTWDPSIQTRGENASRNAKISLAVGSALVITGGVLYVLGRTSSTEAASVAVVPEHEGASLVWGSSF